MKIVKKILLVIGVLILLVLLAALFIPKEYSVEREITINKPGGEVYQYVKQLKNQENWSKWAMEDPIMHKEFKGTDGTVGFVYMWKSDKIGEGEQEITRLLENELVESDLHFVKPFEGKAKASMATQALSSGQTKVKWSFNSRLNYPMNFMVLFMDMTLGRDLNTGLVNLKNVLEN